MPKEREGRGGKARGEREEEGEGRTAVLAADGVALALRVHGDAVARAEPTLDARDLLLEDAVEEPDLEVALSCARRRHVHRLLAAAHDDLLRAKGGVRRQHLRDLA